MRGVAIGSRYIRFIYFCVEDTGNFFIITQFYHHTQMDGFQRGWACVPKKKWHANCKKVPDFDLFSCHSVPFFSNLMNFNSETGFRLLSLRYVLERERKNSRKMKELRNADRISSGDCVSV